MLVFDFVFITNGASAISVFGQMATGVGVAEPHLAPHSGWSLDTLPDGPLGKLCTSKPDRLGVSINYSHSPFFRFFSST